MERTLTLDTPLIVRLAAWQRERFPADTAIVGSVFALAAALCGRFAVSPPSAPLTLRLADLLILLSGGCFLLMLRVFDEHKDYANDVRNYPERVLSRGLVTLDQLKVVGALAIVVQLVASLVADGGVGRATLLFLGVFAYSLLMLKEFFCKAWLEKRLVLYAASHMVITPMSMLWFCQMGAGQAPLPNLIVPFATLSFFGGAAFELTRKTRGPEEERESVDSYTKAIGRTGAPIAIVFVLCVGFAATLVLLHALTGALFSAQAALAALAFVAAVVSVLAFLRAPSAKARSRNEKLVGMFLLMAHVAAIWAVFAERGVSWH